MTTLLSGRTVDAVNVVYSRSGETEFTMELEIDSKADLKLISLHHNSSSIISGFLQFWFSAGYKFGPLDSEIRLYPTGIGPLALVLNPYISNSSSNMEREVIMEEWNGR